MAINLNMRAPAANPLSFAQVDSNFAQLKTAVEDLQKTVALAGHNHNGQYYLKSESDAFNKSIWDEMAKCVKLISINFSSPNTVTGNNQYWGCIDTTFIGRIQWGMAIIPANNSWSSSIRVTYPKAYKEFAPIVLVNALETGNTGGWETQAVAYNNNPTGFDLVLGLLGTQRINKPVPVQWIAFLGNSA